MAVQSFDYEKPVEFQAFFVKICNSNINHKFQKTNCFLWSIPYQTVSDSIV